jgi:peroxiredoxin
MDISVTRDIRVPVGDPKLAAINIERFLIINAGEQAPLFAATTLDKQELKLEDLRGKVVLLDFWATWCAPCIAQMPKVKQAYEQFGADGGFVVVGISLDQDEAAVKQFVEKRGMPWPQIVLGPSEQNPVAKKYNVTGVPATFLIGRDGKVLATDLSGRALQRELRKQFPDLQQQVSR